VFVFAKQFLWQNWAERLERWGLRQLVADLLEASGPLNLLAAQAIYVGQPWLKHLMPDEHWQALTHLLEDPAEAQAFAAFLQENT